MESRGAIQQTPFDLKRRGDFELALKAYAQEYAKALENGSRFIQEICFEQMFDVILLTYFRDYSSDESAHVAPKPVPAFPDTNALMDAIADGIRSELMEVKAYRAEDFKEFMGECRRKFLPRGRAKTAFSVEKEWLVSEEKRRKKR